MGVEARFAILQVSSITFDTTYFDLIGSLVAFGPDDTLFTLNSPCVISLARAGTNGLNGDPGGEGASGFSGYSGASVSGLSGYSGYSGKSGYSGDKGGTGDSGFSGYSGKAGSDGATGSSGYSGYSGKSGYSGANGSNGTSGFSGYSGASGFINSWKKFGTSHVTVSSTNTTAEEVVASVLIPANTLVAGDTIVVTAFAVLASGAAAGTKTFRVRLHTSAAAAGTIYSAAATVTTTGGYFQTLNHIYVKAGSSQEGGGGTALGSVGGTIFTSSLALSSDMYVVFTTQKATGTDTLTLNSYDVSIARA